MIRDDKPDDRARAAPADTGAVGLLLLSFRHRDALADAIARLGHGVYAARRRAGIGRRFLELGCSVAIVDARDAALEALQAAERLGIAVSAAGGAMLLLLDRRDAQLLPAFLAAGITACLSSPWQPGEFDAAIRLAQRSARDGLTKPVDGDAGLWRWQVDLTTGALTQDGSAPRPVWGRDARDACRRLAPADRARAFAALRKLRLHGGYAAFVQHAAPDGGTNTLSGRAVVHHLSLTGSHLSGHVELLDPPAGRGDGLHRDRLTGLPDEAAALALIDTRTQATGVSIVSIIGLEAYNDHAGRAAGDAVLRAMGRQLERCVRADIGRDAIVARVGGTRFAVIAPGQESLLRLDVAMRAMAAVVVDSVLTPVHGGLRLRLATGLAPTDAQADGGARALLRGLAQRLVAPRALVRPLDVELALARAEIAVRFQPQFAMADDRLTGAEALATWRHPKLGELSGAVLFSAASAAGIQTEVSERVWSLALGAMALWPQALYAVRIALNVTAADLAQPALAARLLGLAGALGIDPARLAIEVTESATLGEPATAAANLAALQAAGMAIALDDFGTGYSGLAWLSQLPVDYIKIDSGFSGDADGAPRDRAVLRGVIDLAVGLGLDVLAEGVESEAQRRRLVALGCRWYQGFLRAPALDSGALCRFAIAHDASSATGAK